MLPSHVGKILAIAFALQVAARRSEIDSIVDELELEEQTLELADADNASEVSTLSLSNRMMPPPAAMATSATGSTHTLTCECKKPRFAYSEKNWSSEWGDRKQLYELRPNEALSIDSASPNVQRFIQECLKISPFQYPKCDLSNIRTVGVPGELYCGGMACDQEVIIDAFAAGVAGLFKQVARFLEDKDTRPKEAIDMASCIWRDSCVKTDQGRTILLDLNGKLTKASCKYPFMKKHAQTSLTIAAMYLYALSEGVTPEEVVDLAKKSGGDITELRDMRSALQSLKAASPDFTEKYNTLDDALPREK